MGLGEQSAAGQGALAEQGAERGGGGRDPHQRRQWGGRLALRRPPRN